MARVLGWGSGYAGEEDVDKILTSVMAAKVTPLDRYSLSNRTIIIQYTVDNCKYFKLPDPNSCCENLSSP